MEDIYEIRLHGRGGQGAKTASQFIAQAALTKGKNIQAFPEYGPERTGAPMKAFVRISDKIIHSFAPVVNPDVVLVIDPTLLEKIKVAEGLTDKGILIVNTPNDSNWVKEKTGFNGACYTLDATKISLETVGKNFPNTPMLGALIKITNCVTMEATEEVIKEKFLHKIGEQKTQATIEAIQKAHDSV